MFKISLILWIACCFVLCTIAQAEQLATVEDAIHQVFPNATSLDRENICLSSEDVSQIEKEANVSLKSNQFVQLVRIIVKKDGEPIGSAVQDVVQGRWGPIYFLMGIDSGGAVAGVVVLEYKENRGRPIAKARFLRQYLGKTIADALRLRKDINGITGATVSSRALTDGVRKNLHILKMISIRSAHSACTP